MHMQNTRTCHSFSWSLKSSVCRFVSMWYWVKTYSNFIRFCTFEFRPENISFYEELSNRLSNMCDTKCRGYVHYNGPVALCPNSLLNWHPFIQWSTLQKISVGLLQITLSLLFEGQIYLSCCFSRFLVWRYVEWDTILLPEKWQRSGEGRCFPSAF
jgi:hypothetical protein